MNVTEALLEIKKGNIQPVYFIHGEEAYLIRQLEQTIIETLLLPDERELNLTVFDRDPSSQELIALIETVPFWGEKRVIVVRNTALLKASSKTMPEEEEENKRNHESGGDLMEILPRIPAYSYLVFSTSSKIDKRRKLYKVVNQHGAVVSADPLKIKDARIWIGQKLQELQKKMTPEAMEYFLEIISVMPQISLGFLEQEIIKLDLFTGERRLINRSDLTRVLSAIPEVSIFALIETISSKQVAKAIELLAGQIRMGEHPLRIIALFSRQIRLLWQAKQLKAAGYSPAQIAEHLAVPPFVGEKLVRQGNGFQEKNLKQALCRLAAADWDIKAGKANPVMLEKIVFDLCN
ncbi:dna polymerase iii delta subunit [Lucifera butyrica]|uniref:DNA polymerase III subunit delta n=1 Tax=Lucifera butyrica TaxID=1351585 RepID=A0A498RAB9_9FIRM|nr:DNA polymerase III subunit delta [Lucifera butyrica]VBB06108.1 dna polymerase iii delta subunit [Lucifera butyrica]